MLGESVSWGEEGGRSKPKGWWVVAIDDFGLCRF